MFSKSALLAAATATVLAVGGTTAVMAATTPSVPDPGTAYGCVNSSRAFVDVYTNKTNFQNFLAANGGKCPSGFAVAIGAPSSPAPTPTPTAPATSLPPTAPDPTPTSTSTSPTPVPSASDTSLPPGVGTKTWNCTTKDVNQSDINGACGPYTDLHGGSNASEYVTQDIWNGAGGGGTIASQELDADNGYQWQVIANATGNGAVLSYPDTQDTVTDSNGNDIPVTSYTGLTSSYSTSLPSSPGSSDDYEAAYDIWTSGYGQETMVWTDNHGQTPAGSDTGKTWTDPSTGNAYEIWSTGEAAADQPLVTFVKKTNSVSGSVDLLQLFKFMQSNGYMVSGAGVSQVDYGFEICSTSGKTETFAVNSYTLNATGTGV